jgi:FHA domain
LNEGRSETVAENLPFRCGNCGEVTTLTVGEPATVCASCGSPALEPLEMGAGETGAVPVESDELEPRALPAWLSDPSALLGEPGEYICFEDGGEVVVVPLTREWTRIGRGLAADVRFDDPTVSRRHALIVRHPDGVRLLDDRSLNGVFVNGARVDGKALKDGDEIVIGRYRLAFVNVPARVGALQADAAPTSLHSIG